MTDCDNWQHYFESSGNVFIDLRGHFGSKIGEPASEDIAKYVKDSLSMGLFRFRIRVESDNDDYFLKKYGSVDPEAWPNLNESMKTGKPTANPIPLSGGLIDCPVCGKRLKFLTDGQRVWAEEKCKYAGGMPVYGYEIDIPSGKIVFANDLRREYPVCDNFYVNHETEIRRCSKEYAKVGLLHFFVGNTCPSINKVSDKELLVGRDGCSEDRQVYVCQDRKYHTLSFKEYKKAKMPGRRVGWICTDLWWFSAADYNDLKGRLKFKKLENLAGFRVVKVQPGRYRCSYDYRKWRKLEDSDPLEAAKRPNVYCTIKRVGPVKSKTPPKVKEWPILSLEDTIRIGYLAWPTLHRTREELLDYMYCVIGGSYDWTPNGQLRAGGRNENEARKRIKGVTVPSKVKTSYYPLCDHSPVCKVPDNVRPDYLAGAFEVLNNIINHSDPTDKRCVENVTKAKEVLASLQKRFQR